MLAKTSITALLLPLFTPACADPAINSENQNRTTQLFWQARRDGTHTWKFYEGSVGIGSYACNFDDTRHASYVPHQAPPLEDVPPQAVNETLYTPFLDDYCKFHGNGTVATSGENARLECNRMGTIVCLKDNAPMETCVETDRNFNDTIRAKAISHCDIT
ncbi:hypothetical protein K491DRAFT_684298 [Lophiostoma macrostomum CBS 122681]|uniref:Uncharacterized protein n=1 Tax=Lophiostoma macrostomum CBS 122681 TaxID=1314788 RepID=A0A6A6SRB4_9PLEO|nr:hypothetical protein K491DRAFT_684298 [Lophiostoma macrostomum CBS 122681]